MTNSKFLLPIISLISLSTISFSATTYAAASLKSCQYLLGEVNQTKENSGNFYNLLTRQRDAFVNCYNSAETWQINDTNEQTNIAAIASYRQQFKLLTYWSNYALALANKNEATQSGDNDFSAASNYAFNANPNGFSSGNTANDDATPPQYQPKSTPSPKSSSHIDFF